MAYAFVLLLLLSAEGTGDVDVMVHGGGSGGGDDGGGDRHNRNHKSLLDLLVRTYEDDSDDYEDEDYDEDVSDGESKHSPHKFMARLRHAETACVYALQACKSVRGQ